MSNFLLVNGPPADRAVASDRPTDGEALDTHSCVVTTVARELRSSPARPPRALGCNPRTCSSRPLASTCAASRTCSGLMTEEMIGRAIELIVVRTGEERRVSIMPREL